MFLKTGGSMFLKIYPPKWVNVREKSQLLVHGRTWRNDSSNGFRQAQERYLARISDR